MVSNIQIESWVLMHACKYKYHEVVKGVLSRHHDNLEELDVPQVYLSVAMIYNTVMTNSILNYPVVIQHLDFIYNEVPDAVPFRLYSKFSMGLKMKCSMDLLKKNPDDTLMVLNRYFPRKGSHYEHVTHRELSSLHSAQKNFRKFFLPLLAHQNQREAYFLKEYEDEYGHHYQDALEKLCVQYLEKLMSHLPPTVIEKILAEGPEKYLPLSEGSTHLSMEMLLDTLHGKKALEEKDLLELLTMVSPLHTQDRLQMDRAWLLSSEESKMTSSKSLFSSESDDHLKEPDSNHSPEEIPSDSAKTITYVDLTDSNQNQVKDKTCQQSNATSSSKDDNVKGLRDSFGDFNDKRHLFHCGRKDSQNGELPEKESELKNSGESLESPKSSGVSVSILRKRHLRTETKTCSKAVSEEERTGNSDEDLPEQVQKVTSSSSNYMDQDIPVILDSDTQKSTEENPISVNHIDTEAVTESYEDVALEPWLPIADTSAGFIGNTTVSSESDIDKITDEDIDEEVIPPSFMEDIEFWDVFGCGERHCSTGEPLAVPSIGSHAKHPDMKLCVVKLYRNKMLDRQHGNSGIKFDIFS